METKPFEPLKQTYRRAFEISRLKSMDRMSGLFMAVYADLGDVARDMGRCMSNVRR